MTSQDCNCVDSFTPSDMASKEAFASTQADDSNSVVVEGSLEFVQEKGGNDAPPAYQEASGAPVERKSPLGYNVKWLTAAMLNIGMIIGTGVFSTRKRLRCQP